MLRAVIFDVDNTLYENEQANEQAFQAVTDYAQEILGIPAEDFPALHQEADKLLRLRTGRLCADIHSRLLRYQLVLEKIRECAAAAIGDGEAGLGRLSDVCR